jgi:cytidylate kinase
VPIITISGGTYCGGEAVAAGVADRLGHRYIKRDVISGSSLPGGGESAEDSIAAMEQRPPLWNRVTGRRADHLHQMRAALCEMGDAGKVVYYGYLGHLLLAAAPRLLRVRVMTDRETRIQEAMLQQHLSRHDAIAHLERVDTGRRQWTRFLFEVDWEDPAQFDLVLNRASLGTDAVCDIISRTALRSAYADTTDSIQDVRDFTLKTRVAARLALDPRTAGAPLEVAADSGSVTISGEIKSLVMIEAAMRVVGEVEGVEERINRIQFTGDLMSVPY